MKRDGDVDHAPVVKRSKEASTTGDVTVDGANGAAAEEGDPAVCIRVGSRDSALAMQQTNHVIAMLKAAEMAAEFKVQSMKTLGDRILDVALPKIGDKGLFTKDLEAALACKAVDFVVHSLKDVPSSLPDNMLIAAILEREDPRDVVVLHPKHAGKVKSLGDLPEGAVVGTSSVRRSAQLQRVHPHVTIKSVRGNLNTRLSKLDDHSDYDCLVLAAAGIKRLGFTERISWAIEEAEMLYAVGQGALAVECRENDGNTRVMLACLNHTPTVLAVTAERTLMIKLGGGCSVPLGVETKWEGTTLTMVSGVFQHDGSEALRKTAAALVTTVEEARALGTELADLMLAAGAKRILDSARAATGIANDPRAKPDAPK